MDLFETFFNSEVLQRSWQMLIKGLWLTLQLGAASILAGLVLGLTLCLMRLYAMAPVRCGRGSTSTSSARSRSWCC